MAEKIQRERLAAINPSLSFVCLLMHIVLSAAADYNKFCFTITEEMEQGEDLLLFNINMHIGASTSESTDDEVAKGKIKDSWLPMFSFSSVFAATDNFSTENKLGEGGFGPVYKVHTLSEYYYYVVQKC